MVTIDSFKTLISDLLENYNKEDIFSTDECCLFYQAFLSKTLVMAGDKYKIEIFQTKELPFWLLIVQKERN